MKNDKEIRFYYNGLKIGNSKKLLTANIEYCNIKSEVEKVVYIGATKYTRFTDEVLRSTFDIRLQNNERQFDRFHITKESEYFKEALSVCLMSLQREKRILNQKIKACSLSKYDLPLYQESFEDVLNKIKEINEVLEELDKWLRA